MSKQSELEKYRGYIMENGIAHIRYEVTEINDIIHPLSIKGDEMLSDDFISFFEKYRVIIPAKAPVVLELSGKALDDKEKELIDTTIWSHFCMHMTSADIQARACIKRSLMFLIYTVLSAVLIFGAETVNEEVITSIAYLPFWFFGYRLLIYLMIDCIPLWKDRKWYRQLAAMTLVFSGNRTGAEDIIPDAIEVKTEEYIDETDKKLRDNRRELRYYKKKGIAELGCTAGALGDIVETPVIREREFMSGTLSSYLSQAEPFLDTDSRITLEIQGMSFDDEEKHTVCQAVKHYYGFRIAAEELGIWDTRNKILLYTFMVFVSAVLIVCWGTKVDVATHEFISMLLWFFGDYLLEFILLTHSEYRKNKKMLENCRDMEIRFTP